MACPVAHKTTFTTQPTFDNLQFSFCIFQFAVCLVAAEMETSNLM
jgi:hypothetical protein